MVLFSLLLLVTGKLFSFLVDEIWVLGRLLYSHYYAKEKELLDLDPEDDQNMIPPLPIQDIDNSKKPRVDLDLHLSTTEITETNYDASFQLRDLDNDTSVHIPELNHDPIIHSDSTDFMSVGKQMKQDSIVHHLPHHHHHHHHHHHWRNVLP